MHSGVSYNNGALRRGGGRLGESSRSRGLMVIELLEAR